MLLFAFDFLDDRLVAINVLGVYVWHVHDAVAVFVNGPEGALFLGSCLGSVVSPRWLLVLMGGWPVASMLIRRPCWH